MEVSPYLEKYTRKKVHERVEKFLSRPREARVSFYTSKKDFGCHIHVSGDGYDCFVSAVSTDMYSAVNAVIVKLESQLRKRKERLKHNRSKKKIGKIREEESALLERASLRA